jgi:hypothetical protein
MQQVRIRAEKRFPVSTTHHLATVLATRFIHGRLKDADSDGFCGLQGYEFSLDISVSMR